MSYDIYLIDKDTGEELKSKEPHNIRGGSYAEGDVTLYLNITFNYHDAYKKHGLWLPELDQRLVKDVISKLFSVYNQLEGEPSVNYWEATDGNAKKALGDLIKLCSLAPEAKIKVYD